MRIAVDARPLSVPITGIGRYTWSLLNAMIPTSPPDWEWFLYSDRPLIIDTSHWHAVTVRNSAYHGRLPSSLIQQLLFPIWAGRDKVDVFWSPRHHLPMVFCSKLRKIVTIHDLVWIHYPETMLKLNLLLEKLLMPRALSSADRVIAVSHATREDLKAQFSTVIRKLTVVSGAASMLPEYGNEDVPPHYLLFVGTLEPRKNLQRLLAAFSQLKAAGLNDYRLLIVGGSGWGEQKMEDLLRDYGLVDAVELHGYVSDQRLHQLYRHARALLMPSLYEGFGLPLLEAMQYGTPVITSNTSSMPEVAGDAGLLIDPLSTDELCEAMRRIIRDDELHERLSNRASQRAREFSWERSAQTMIGVIDSLGDRG